MDFLKQVRMGRGLNSTLEEGCDWYVGILEAIKEDRKRKNSDSSTRSNGGDSVQQKATKKPRKSLKDCKREGPLIHGNFTVVAV